MRQSMSKLSLYRQKVKAMESLKEEIQKLEDSEALKKDMDFMQAIETVLDQYGRQLSDLPTFFPELSSAKAGKRSSSPVRTFKNPETGETIQAQRTNNKTLRSWVEQFGKTAEELEVK